LNNEASLSLQGYDYFVVLDFEATCDEEGSANFSPQEIIEFPACLLNARTLKVEDEFQLYVKPIVHPLLTPFCIQLTGIQQEQVEDAVSLEEALDKFEEWLIGHRIIAQNGKSNLSFAFVTWGSWDLMLMLPTQCGRLKIKQPYYYNQWIDLKILFKQRFGSVHGGLPGAMEHLGIPWVGRQHCGLDDARNTTYLVMNFVQDKILLTITHKDGKLVKKQQNTIQTTLTPNLSTSEVIKKCACGIKVKMRKVGKPGPNRGRTFLSCGAWTIQCNYFEWVERQA